jgi:chromosome segregation ATPase
MALAQREQDQLVLEATERQEELKKTREEIAHYQEKLIELQNECSYLKQSTEIASCSQREYEGEAKKYAEEIEILKKQMTAAEIKSKQVLKQEVDRLKSEFNEVITAFEKELVDTCENNASEVDRLQKKLNESRDTISLLEIQITEMKSQNKQVMDQLDEKMSVEIDLAKARKQLVEAEAVEKSLAKLQQQHESLMESFDEIKNINLDLAKTLEETESSKQELKNKLHETLVTVDNNLKAYNDLRADHDKLQKECDMLKGDATSLHSLVSSLTCEKEKLMNDIDNVEGSKSSLEQEVGKYKEHQSSLEELITSLREELETKTENIQSLQNDKSSKQQQIDALQEQSKIANGHLDEMVTYCDKLKTDFASTSASLRKEIDKQAESMKDVINALKNQLLASENEKEENRKMYESDIELQQSVSFYGQVGIVWYDI